jgi:hypothetical protein
MVVQVAALLSQQAGDAGGRFCRDVCNLGDDRLGVAGLSPMAG